MALARAFLSLFVLSCSIARLAPAQLVTYQGQLKSGGVPVNGACDIIFRLFAVAEGGTQVGTTYAGVDVTGGVFTSSFYLPADPSSARFLDLQVRCPTNVGEFTQLTPRQQLTTVVGAGQSLGGAFSSEQGFALIARSALGISTTATAPGGTGLLTTATAPGSDGLRAHHGTSRAVVATTDTGIAVNAQANVAGGTALRAIGHTKQQRAYGGLIKAIVRVFGDALTRCFRGDEEITNEDASSCTGFSVSGSGGANTVTFPFQVNDRYVVITPEHDVSVPVFSTYSFTAANQVLVRTWTCPTGGAYTPCGLYGSAFTIAIY